MWVPFRCNVFDAALNVRNLLCYVRTILGPSTRPYDSLQALQTSIPREPLSPFGPSLPDFSGGPGGPGSPRSPREVFHALPYQLEFEISLGIKQPV